MKLALSPRCVLILIWYSACLLAATACGDDGASSEEEPFVWEEWPAPLLPEVPRPEAPDPSFARRDWISLNGEWEFAFDPEDKGLTEAWATREQAYERTIIVPFPWSSALSGVKVDTGDRGGIGWYRRHVRLPDHFAGRHTLLRIGAADWDVSVFVNGRTALPLGQSGYLPLLVDITDFLTPGDNTLVIRAKDYGNDASYPHGKQGVPWYANVGGIWQSVTLEASTATRLQSLHMLPDLDRKRFSIAGSLAGSLPAEGCVVRVYAKDRGSLALFSQPLTSPTFSGEIDTSWLTPWSPEDPVLQEFEWRLVCGGQTDVVRTFAGLRKVSRETLPGLDVEAVHLNGSPVYLRGVLVQGYHPQGHYTYPNEHVMLDDLNAAKKAGFNLVRLHIKTEDPLLLHHADRLGMLVDDDIPCYGAFPFETGDGPAARARWQSIMEGQIRRDINHPSILWWTLFNEDWGFGSLTEAYDAEKQSFAKSMLARARELDPSRLVEDHSTLRYDHVSGTDLNSFHLYQDDPAAFLNELENWSKGCYPGSSHNFAKGETQDGAPLINAEYGPFSAEYGSPQWRRDRDISWGFRMLTTLLRSQEKMVGYIFTELYDVEFELNGVLRYDRRVKEFGYPFDEGPAALQGSHFVGFSEASFQVPQETTSLTLHPFLSRFAPEPDENKDAETLRLALYDADDAPLWETSLGIEAASWRVSPQAPVEVPLPDTLKGGVYVLAEWKRGAEILAKNFLPGERIAPEPPATECDASGCRIALDLDACSGPLDEVSTVRVDGKIQALGLLGTGVVTCPATLPPQFPAGKTISAHVEAELAANREGAPQTTFGDDQMGQVSLMLGDLSLGNITLPPDRADSRGILSYLNGSIPKGGYGEKRSSIQVEAELTAGTTVNLRFETGPTEGFGFMLYGRRLGRYGLPPTLVLSWDEAR